MQKAAVRPPVASPCIVGINQQLLQPQPLPQAFPHTGPQSLLQKQLLRPLMISRGTMIEQRSFPKPQPQSLLQPQPQLLPLPPQPPHRINRIRIHHQLPPQPQPQPPQLLPKENIIFPPFHARGIAKIYYSIGGIIVTCLRL